MNCPYLKEVPYHASLASRKLLSCEANKLLYVPSIIELDVYCRHIRHTSCIFYADYEDRRGAAAEQQTAEKQAD